VIFGALEDPRAVVFVGLWGIVPGTIAGAIIGALAGATKHSPRWVRALIIMVPAVLATAFLGALFGALEFVPFALIPTLALCALLEWRTYVPWPDPASLAVDADASLDPYAHVLPARRSGVKVSMLVGAAVMLIAMIGVGQHEPRLHGLYEAYFPWGAGVGVGLAMPFGVLADCAQDLPVWMRRGLLLLAGIALTAGLGVLAGMEHLIAIAFIPVAAGCLLLERYSRRATVVPAAVARA
jgi:hypothetical protein